MHVVSVFGPFNSRALVEMSVDQAVKLFPKDAILAAEGPSRVIAAVEHDLEALSRDAPDLANSALSATALQMAYELEHPYNSATSKSMCAKALHDIMDRLRELAPPVREEDSLDELRSRREARTARVSTAAD